MYLHTLLYYMCKNSIYLSLLDVNFEDEINVALKMSKNYLRNYFFYQSKINRKKLSLMNQWSKFQLLNKFVLEILVYGNIIILKAFHVKDLNILLIKYQEKL